jgi:glycosyltransferase involved in cell wall biosynthesis
MKLSFVIPAFNEAKSIEACLQHIHDAVAECDEYPASEVECIVVDNNSTDDTATRAEAAGARTVFEPINQISRARNAGAKVAQGDWLIFIDADSYLSTELLAAVLALIDGGEHVGCGSVMEMRAVPFMWRLSIRTWNWLSVLMSWAAGSFVVCRADVFAELGGFSGELFVSEEIEFSRRVKRYARQHGKKFVVLRDHPLLTSGRKAELYTQRELLKQTYRMIIRPRKTIKSRADLDVWYDGRR